MLRNPNEFRLHQKVRLPSPLEKYQGHYYREDKFQNFESSNLPQDSHLLNFLMELTLRHIWDSHTKDFERIVHEGAHFWTQVTSNFA